MSINPRLFDLCANNPFMTRPSFNTNKPFAIVPDILLINIKFTLCSVHFIVWCHDPFMTMPCCLRVRAWHPLYLLRGLHLTSSLLLSLVFYVNIRVGSVIQLFLLRCHDIRLSSPSHAQVLGSCLAGPLFSSSPVKNHPLPR